MRLLAIRLLGLAYAGQVAWLTGTIFAISSNPLEALIAAAVLTAPLLGSAIDLYFLRPTGRILGFLFSLISIYVIGAFGLIVVALAAYAVLPKSAQESFAPIRREADDAHPELARFWKPWFPIAIAAPIFALSYGLMSAMGRPRMSLSQLGIPLGDLLALGLIFSLLFGFARGSGWSGRARLQIMVWCSVLMSGYFNGVGGVVATVGLLFVALMFVATRQRFPLIDPLHEQAVDLSAFHDAVELRRFLIAASFRPLAQLQSKFATGVISEEVYARSDGIICHVSATSVGSVVAYVVRMETWLDDGRSIRSTNQLRREDVNDPVRHSLRAKVAATYEELLAYHRANVSHERTPQIVVGSNEYLRLRHRAYDDSFRSGIARGLIVIRNEHYRMTLKAGWLLVVRSFNLIDALASERVS